MERILLAFALLPGVAFAQQRPCAPHEKMAEALLNQYGEEAQVIGLAEDSTVMELYAAPETGTWTLAVTMPNGVTCLMASGRNFEAVSPTAVKGDPA